MRGIGAGLLIGALLVPGQMAVGATHLQGDPARLMSTDSFGECVPEENLDEIWLVFAGAKSGRIPHVCMQGDCEDMPDIATWASMQQYPEDIDLDRDEVQAKYAAFVGEYCAGTPEEEEVPAVDLNVPEEGEFDPEAFGEEEVPAVLLEAPLLDPPLSWGAPSLFSPRTFNNTPAPFMPRLAPFSGLGGPAGGGATTAGFTGDPLAPLAPLVPTTPEDPFDPGTPPWGDSPGTTPPGTDDPDSPYDPGNPPSVVPLPAPLLMLLSALGLLGLLRCRARG